VKWSTYLVVAVTCTSVSDAVSNGGGGVSAVVVCVAVSDALDVEVAGVVAGVVVSADALDGVVVSAAVDDVRSGSTISDGAMSGISA
jgi:hypothetical protein